MSDQSCAAEAFHFIAHREMLKKKKNHNTIRYITAKIYSQATELCDLGTNANTYNETDY